MALSVTTGLATASTAGTTTTVSHSFGAAPKAIILWTTGQTSTGSDAAANASWGYGFSDGTNHRSIGWASDDNVATTNCGKAFRTDRIVEIFSAGTPTTLRYVSGVTFNTSDFVLTFDGTPASAYLIGYMLLGGSDITNVIVGTQTLTTSTGAQSVTGLAFQPDFGIFINAQATAAGTAARALGSIGWARSSSKEFTMAWGIDDAQNMTGNIDAVSYTNAAACMSGITAGAETVDFLADFTSFNSDGYTVNVSNAPTAAWLVGYLLIKGGQWDAGNDTFPTSLTEVISSVAFQPQGLMYARAENSSDATVQTGMSSGVGAAVSTSTEVWAYGNQSDAILNTAVSRYTSSSNLNEDTSGAHAFDFTSFDSNGFTLTSVGAGNFAYKYGWFVCADNAAAPTTTGDGWTGKGGWW